MAIFLSGPQSPDCIRADTLNALDMSQISRVALWSMYNNNASPPTSNNTTSPPNNEPQRYVKLFFSRIFFHHAIIILKLITLY